MRGMDNLTGGTGGVAGCGRQSCFLRRRAAAVVFVAVRAGGLGAGPVRPQAKQDRERAGEGFRVGQVCLRRGQVRVFW